MTARYILPAGYPHKGWTEVGVTDMGEDGDDDRKTCAACGKESIRYVHHLHHAEAGLNLDVGCICACHLTGDYAGPKAAERAARNRAAAASRRAKAEEKRREEFIARHRRGAWLKGKRGGWWLPLKPSPWRAIAWQEGCQWRAKLVHSVTGEERRSRHLRQRLEEVNAPAAALAYRLTWADGGYRQ